MGGPGGALPPLPKPHPPAIPPDSEGASGHRSAAVAAAAAPDGGVSPPYWPTACFPSGKAARTPRPTGPALRRPPGFGRGSPAGEPRRSRAAGGWGQRRRLGKNPRGGSPHSGAGFGAPESPLLRRRRRLLRPSHRRSQPLRSLGSASAGVVGQSPGNLGPRAAGVGTLQNATRAGSLTSGTSGAGNPRPFGGNRSVPLPAAALGRGSFREANPRRPPRHAFGTFLANPLHWRQRPPPFR